MRPTLMVPVKDREQFLEMYFEKDGQGGLFVHGGTDLSLGDEVDVELHFLDTHTTFQLRGQVRWRRTASGRRSLPPGLGIEFLPEEESARALLLDYAMGKEVSMVARHRRFSARIPVKYRADGTVFEEETDDISEGGAFILTDEAFAVGDRMRLTLRAPGRLFGISVDAKVAWRRDGGRRGVGVEFLFGNGAKRARIEKLIASLRSSMIREVRVRVPALEMARATPGNARNALRSIGPTAADAPPPEPER